MVLNIEKTLHGKPCMVIDNHKYRLERTRASGDVVWRCLSKGCSACVITNLDYTEITEYKNKHVGKHPVTMRSLSSPPITPTSATTATASLRSGALTPRTPRVVTSATPRTPRAVTSAATQTDCSMPRSNDELQGRVDELTHQGDCMVDLIQRVTIAVDRELSHLLTTPHADCIKAFISNSESQNPDVLDVENKTSKVFGIFSAIVNKLQKQMDGYILDLGTKESIISTLNDNLNSINIDLESAKRDNALLNNELQRLSAELHDITTNTDTRLDDLMLPSRPPVPTSNRYQGLLEAAEEAAEVVASSVSEVTAPAPRNRGRKRRKLHPSNISISVFADSHGRGLSGKLKNIFSNKNSEVKTGVVKPGAPLSEIVRSAKSGSVNLDKNNYVVCIGGTNDIARRNELVDKNILSSYHSLTASAPKCRFIISTIPPRYDLSPYSNENKKIRSVNKTIKSLENTEKNVKILDLGSKLPHLFRGIHFHSRGKTILCKEIHSVIDMWSRQPYPLDPLHADNAPVDTPGPSGLGSDPISNDNSQPMSHTDNFLE